MKKEWQEAEATASVRRNGVDWSEDYLALNGVDASANGQPGPTVSSSRSGRKN